MRAGLRGQDGGLRQRQLLGRVVPLPVRQPLRRGTVCLGFSYCALNVNLWAINTHVCYDVARLFKHVADWCISVFCVSRRVTGSAQHAAAHASYNPLPSLNLRPHSSLAARGESSVAEPAVRLTRLGVRQTVAAAAVIAVTATPPNQVMSRQLQPMIRH